ncbi:hypothetical protein CDAR_498371 [Caerostris darwini]|uniref:Uncharacterized protein n=1 Tax=Caerostris darwini TaxID=1538125 RepID=A0AAV4U035_9ARAC|nr:hypothetical protein CDAR_498371 [Caerostris darwini]
MWEHSWHRHDQFSATPSSLYRLRRINNHARQGYEIVQYTETVVKVSFEASFGKKHQRISGTEETHHAVQNQYENRVSYDQAVGENAVQRNHPLFSLEVGIVLQHLEYLTDLLQYSHKLSTMFPDGEPCCTLQCESKKKCAFNFFFRKCQKPEKLKKQRKYQDPEAYAPYASTKLDIKSIFAT